MAPVVQIHDVTKKFGRSFVIKDLSFNVEQNDLFGLIGSNGAGKTTIVNMLMGFIRQTCGKILIRNFPVSNPKSRVGIGYLPEDSKLPLYLSGKEFLQRKLRHINFQGNTNSEISRVCEITGTTSYVKKKIGSMSKGMKRRIEFSATLLGNPDLLILDEPTSGLDPIGMVEFRKILLSLHQDGKTIILNSHLLSEIENNCTKIAIINDGKVIKIGSQEEILCNYKNLEAAFVESVNEYQSN